MPENKVVSEQKVYIAEISVYKDHHVVVNPNGRNYEADNVERDLSGEVIKVKVRAGTPEHLAEKIQTIMGTIDGDQ